MTEPPLSMAEAATFRGLSYERFRKCWRELLTSEGFPAPFVGGPRRAYAWRLADLQAWQEDRVRTLAALAGADPPKRANDDEAPAKPSGRSACGNQILMSLMASGR